MRVGRNPLTNKTMAETSDKVAAVITHLPDMDGYHEHRLDVIKACLTTMRTGAPGIPVIVWDNGSCEELRSWLINDFKPETLILSPNVGKSNARYSIFRMMPDCIVSMSDDDMLYYPGWFDACLELLTSFPEVGKVSCYPVRTQGRWGCSNTKAWAKDNAKLEAGRFLPDEYDYDFCTSIGRDYDWHKEYSKLDIDYRVTYKGLQAYCYAHHCQFMARAGTIIPFLQKSTDCMADEKPFDNAVNDAGLLQLTTVQRYCRHIGNVIDTKVYNEIALIQEKTNG